MVSEEHKAKMSLWLMIQALTKTENSLKFSEEEMEEMMYQEEENWRPELRIKFMESKKQIKKRNFNTIRTKKRKTLQIVKLNFYSKNIFCKFF